jgi:predicted PurR-regulated permease PerM
MVESNGSPLNPPPAAVPSPKVEGPLTTGRPLRPVALAGITFVLIVLCAYLAWPLLPAITWALALAIIAWPLHVWVSRQIRWPGVAAGISSLAVLVLVLGPFLFVSYKLAQEATSAAERMKTESAEGVLKDTMQKTPGLRKVNSWADRMNVDVDQQVRNVVTAYTKDASSIVQGSVDGIIQAVVALFILFHLFKDRGSLTRSVHTLLPLTRDEAEQVFARVADAVQANLYANVVTSIIAAAGGGIMFYLTGLPSPVLWAVVMFVLSLLPILGTFVIWVPAAVYLAATDQWPQAAALAGWGALNTVLVDNLLYFLLAGNRMRLHQVPSLLAILGGLYLFGASGVILGPTILAVTVAVLEVWHRRATATAATPKVLEPALNGPPVGDVVVAGGDRSDPAVIGPGQVRV